MTAAIRASSISKRFRIPLDKSTTLKYRVTHLRSSGRFHDLLALNDVSFEVFPGEFVGIIGRNGCGKSTLLKILSAIYRPTSGRVEVAGRVSPFLELGLGFNPELTARENVFVNGAVLGLTRSQLKDRLDHIIQFADLQDFVDQKLKNFSSGMEVRLAFSVAIQADAEILLMDEVLAVGDAQFQEKCFDIFWQYKRQGKTIVLVTHDLDAVERYADRAILLEKGRLLADGACRDVITQYRRLVEQRISADTQEAAADNALVAEDAGDGSGEVRITAVRVLDGDGQPVSTVRTGTPVGLEMEIESHAELGEVVCGFAVHRADGLHLWEADTRDLGFTVVPLPVRERSCVVYGIDRLPLLGGTYLVSASVADKHTGHVYARSPLEFTFKVTEETRHLGLVALNGRWSRR